MTYNEFKLCCTLFCEAFEGRKYGEIVKGCHEVDFDTTISMNFTYDIYCDVYFNNSLVMYYKNKRYGIYIHGGYNYEIKTVEDFLNYFKIPLEDIV